MKWPLSADIDLLLVDGVRPSLVDDGKSWLSSFGLYEPGAVWVTGLPKAPEKGFWQKLSSYFFSPTTNYFAEKIALQRPFKTRGAKLRLPSSTWKRVRGEMLQKKIYRRRVRQLWRNETDKIVSSCWSVPLNSRINSPFGKPRFLPNGKKYYHSGVDLRAPAGQPLKAPADGLVVFAELSVVPGKTVILYHGAGVHSQYMHMSKIKVQEGQRVSQGELIGLTGATGRVEGPHLHWEIRWKGRHADPFSFLEAIGSPCRRQSI